MVRTAYEEIFAKRYVRSMGFLGGVTDVAQREKQKSQMGIQICRPGRTRSLPKEDNMLLEIRMADQTNFGRLTSTI